MAGAVLAVTVFCFVLGSASVSDLVGPGRKLRWLALFALAAVATALVLRDRRAFREAHRVRVVLVTGAWLVAVSLVSVAWSVDPRLTLGRAGSFAVLLGTAAALCLASLVRPQLVRALLLGILAGAAAATIAGLVVLAASYTDAIQPKTSGGPSRYRGLGESPDTVAMLAALAAPIGLWLLLNARSRAGRLAGVGAVVLLVGSISWSGSRGGLLGVLVGGLVVATTLPVPRRRRLALALAVCITMAGASVTADHLKPTYPVPAAVPGQAGVPQGQGQGQGQGGSGGVGGLAIGAPVDSVSEHAYHYLLADELYRTYAGNRPFLSTSGRLQAWYEAIKQGNARPALGYGFGTEEKVFIDRVYNFNGGHAESSIVGFYLQVGLIGLASLLLVFVAVGVSGLAAVRRATGLDDPALAAAGLVAAGLVLTLVQSYVYSVGNVATVAFWVGAFALAALARVREPLPPDADERPKETTFAAA